MQACPGVTSTNAGKSELCKGCPNQKLCSSGKAGVEDACNFYYLSRSVNLN